MLDKVDKPLLLDRLNTKRHTMTSKLCQKLYTITQIVFSTKSRLSDIVPTNQDDQQRCSL